MLTIHPVAEPMTARSFGACAAVAVLGDRTRGRQTKRVAGFGNLRTNATTIPVGRPTSSPDRWTG